MKRRRLFEQIKAATVAICRVEEDNHLKPFGSAINIHPDGFIVTAAHVLQDALQHPIVRPSDGGSEAGTILTKRWVGVFVVPLEHDLFVFGATPVVWGGLHSHDLAFASFTLPVDAPIDSFPYLEFGDSQDVYEGEQVITCGFPLGADLQPGVPIGSLFQQGIVSSIRPHATSKSRDLFYLDMTTNPGNSGGPLCSKSSGHVVGIVHQRINQADIPTGIGCAVPINLVKDTAQQMAATPINELAEQVRERIDEQDAKDSE